MNIDTVTLAYFSPTGTTKKVLEAVAEGFGAAATQRVDLTRPEVREQALSTSENELLVVGVPVYMGRVPALLSDWLGMVKAQNTPVVCVAVYGNRVYDDALLELKDVLVQSCCVPVAGAAYIGEHSFSSEATPIAHGRPDSDDLQDAIAFGQKVQEKVDSIESVMQIPELQVDGNHPYGGVTQLWDVDFIAVSEDCTQCGVCAKVCPVGAIDPQDSRQIDIQKCITCCACIKKCPQNARSMKPSPVEDASKRLNNLFSEPKQPEWFL